MRLFLLSALLFLATVVAAKPSVEHYSPPFWYIGMPNNTVQIILHGKDLKDSEIIVDQQGIRITEVYKVENPNYAIIDLQIDPVCTPGTYNIKIKNGTEEIVVGYELKARSTNHQEIRGLDNSDFIYLIFPDRFSNGDPKNDKVVGMTEQTLDRKEMFDRHGGDLQGIINHLDYVQSLGATALWLNPVQENDQPEESYHGYAITDHYQIDARLGTNELYKELVQKTHDRGMKMIMDVVFNHTGNNHWLIKDLPARDWIHQQETFERTNYRATTLMDPYASKYDRDLMTDGWFDTHMPDLNQANPFVARHLIQNSIWWVEYARIDAFRIDTYAYSDQQFMAEWALEVKMSNPSVTFFGETWVHGTPVQAWFTGNAKVRPNFQTGLPGVTDFQLYYAINEAMNGEFGWTDGVARIYYTLAKDYIYDNAYNNVVFVDNHDLSRFYSMVGEDLNKFKMGMAFLMTTRGIPMIYYGTEVLMKNYADPDGKVREDFPGGWDGDKLNYFKANSRSGDVEAAWNYISSLGKWRMRHPALHDGRLTQFVPEKGVYVYFRHNGLETIMVIMNTNEEAVDVNTDRFQELMGGYTKATEPMMGDTYKDLSSIKVQPNSVTILELMK